SEDILPATSWQGAKSCRLFAAAQSAFWLMMRYVGLKKSLMTDKRAIKPTRSGCFFGIFLFLTASNSESKSFRLFLPTKQKTTRKNCENFMMKQLPKPNDLKRF